MGAPVRRPRSAPRGRRPKKTRPPATTGEEDRLSGIVGPRELELGGSPAAAPERWGPPGTGSTPPPRPRGADPGLRARRGRGEGGAGSRTSNMPHSGRRRSHHSPANPAHGTVAYQQSRGTIRPSPGPLEPSRAFRIEGGSVPSAGARRMPKRSHVKTRLHPQPLRRLGLPRGHGGHLAHALRERGAEVRFTLCDGSSGSATSSGNTTGDASGHRPPTRAPTARPCSPPTWRATRWSGSGSGPGSPVTASRASRRGSLAWRTTSSLTPWSGQPVGEWAKSSAFNQFRLSHPLEDPEVVQVLVDRSSAPRPPRRPLRRLRRVPARSRRHLQRTLLQP